MDQEMSYQQVSEALARLTLTMDGAELQGIFCGRLVSGQGMAESGWMRELIGERDEANLQAREDVTLLAGLLGKVVQQLNDAGLQFRLLLPEEASLAERTEALGAWCEGFLYGYGTAVGGQPLTTSETGREFLQDLMEISRVSFEVDTGGEESDEDEMDYIEIVEHLRLGTLLLYEEAHPVATAATSQLH
jgi:yecA family protein